MRFGRRTGPLTVRTSPAGFATVADVERLADELACDLREVDPVDVFRAADWLVRERPLVAAQVLVALAAFVDVDEPRSRRAARVDAIAGVCHVA